MLSIQLFGSPQFSRDGHPLSINRRKSRALLYYLAAHEGPVTRDHLLAFFWPDYDRTDAQPILRTTVYGLRKVLGDDLLAEDLTVALGAAVEVDAIRFEQQLSQAVTDIAHLTATLDLYQGDFLADVTLPDTPNFEDWVAVEQERYRRLAVRGLTVLSQLHEGQQDYRAALAALERALSFDSLQEDLQRAALRLHYVAGDRASAIRRYEKFRHLLDEEMGVPPMAETRALYDAIITDTLVTAPAPSASPDPPPAPACPIPEPTELPFAGRQAELEQLQQIVRSRKLALIEGEAGIGKSRLIDQFIRSTIVAKSTANGTNQPDQPPLMLFGQARELEQAFPYHPLIEALRQLVKHAAWPVLQRQLELAPIWLQEISRLLPELGATPLNHPVPRQAADESRLWEAVWQFLQAVARHRRLLVALDDLQWADATTLGLLGYLIRQAAATNRPISFIAATRPTLPRSPLAILSETLVRENRLERLSLQPLTPADIADLSRHLITKADDTFTDWLTRTSEGNPLFLDALVSYARENNILDQNGLFNAAALPDSPPVPDTVYTLIQSRLIRLSEAAQRVLNAAVAVGREFEFDVVARAAALSDSAALDALDELRAARLVHPIDDGLSYSFDHNLTMEVAWREVGEPRHRLLHRRVGEALENLYRDRLDSVAGLLAQHFAEGNAPERATRYAMRAGKRAADLAAWSEAVSFYEQALHGVERLGDDEDRHPILMALGRAYLQSGHYPQASESFRSAYSQAQKRTNLLALREAQMALAQSLLVQARYTEVITLAQQACADGDPPSAVNAEYMWGLALSHESRDLVEAGNHLRRASALLRQHPPTKSETEAAPFSTVSDTQITFELGNVLAQQGDLRGAIQCYRDVLASVQQTDQFDILNMQILAHNNLAYHLHLLNDPTAVEHARIALNLASEQGLIGMMTFIHSTLGELAMAEHDLTAAEAHFNQGLDLARRFNAPERITGLTANMGLLAAERGQTTLAIHHLSTALAQADTLGIRFLATRIRLWLAPLLPPAEAQMTLAEARSLADSSGYQQLLTEAKALTNQLHQVNRQSQA